MILVPSEQLLAIDSVLKQVRARIEGILPGVETHHVGATAIPGALTKGDLDVVLRIERSEFHAAIEGLRMSFQVKQPENWDAHFASFGCDTDYAVPVGVQLVVRDSEADFFLFVRDYLISHPEALEVYNRAKLQSAENGADEYWSAKNRVLSAIIALKPKPANKAPEPTPTAVTPRAVEVKSK